MYNSTSGLNQSTVSSSVLPLDISKVRSLTLDKWEPSLLNFLISIGNERLNSSVWASMVPADQTRPGEGPDWIGREAWILAKYRDKKFIPPTAATKEQMVVALHTAVKEGELDRASLALLPLKLQVHSNLLSPLV